jgi:hypothetical protein
VQHEAALRLNRAAVHDRPLGQATVREVERELAQHLAERQVARAVDDDAERAFGVVLADVSDGLVEIRIRHRWHRNQEVILQRLHRRLCSVRVKMPLS